MKTPDESTSLKIAYITAGGAGMFCGSCMRDNTIARCMHQLGHEVTLVPMYTPIRVDEEDVSSESLFYGGINVYMEQNVPGYRFLPDFLTQALDQRWLIRWATSRGIETSAKQLGGMTLSMLKGEHGNQRKEAIRLAKWIAESVGPDVINLTNMLIAGCVESIKKLVDCPVVITLQGDDIFMDELPEPYRSKCFQQIQQIIPHIDAFIVFSQYYAGYMAEYFGIPREKFRIVPLGIDPVDFDLTTRTDFSNEVVPTVGYLARMAPEKGLHVLVDSFVALKKMQGMENTRLKVAGWAGKQQQPYVDEQLAKLRTAGIDSHCDYIGTIDREGKRKFLREIDVLSVPTTYRDPKGLFVLEALASAVPVIQPDHGAFPELVSQTSGGFLVPPENSAALAEKLHEVLSNMTHHRALGIAAAQAVRTQFTSHVAAKRTIEMYQALLKCS